MASNILSFNSKMEMFRFRSGSESLFLWCVSCLVGCYGVFYGNCNVLQPVFVSSKEKGFIMLHARQPNSLRIGQRCRWGKSRMTRHRPRQSGALIPAESLCRRDTRRMFVFCPVNTYSLMLRISAGEALQQCFVYADSRGSHGTW